ncbi:MAG: hypothetical protein L6R28_11160 [Planctomycetes bacterium]|nr:hypothetical protein [Planctomycetota bacterium]
MRCVLVLLLFAVPAVFAADAEEPKPELRYANDFETLKPEQIKDEFLIMAGEFALQKDGANTVIELPGKPVDDVGLLFGPTSTQPIVVQARIFATKVRRRTPAFCVGVNGRRDYRLRVNPASEAMELLRDGKVLASAEYKWASGQWTVMRLQVTSGGEGVSRLEGKVWTEGQDEPKEWMVAHELKEAVLPARASLYGAPYSEKPIRFDDLKVEPAEKK